MGPGSHRSGPGLIRGGASPERSNPRTVPRGGPARVRRLRDHAGTTGPASGASWGSAPRRSRRRPSLGVVAGVEKALVDSGVILLEHWLEGSATEQEVLRPSGRLRAAPWRHVRRHRLRRAPRYAVRTDDKRRGRLNLITHLLGQVPCEPLEPRQITLPSGRRRRAAHPHAVL